MVRQNHTTMGGAGGSDVGSERPDSWAATEQDVAERRARARRLEGARLAAVRYVTIDYRREELHPSLHGAGPRLIEDHDEWKQPTWKFDGFDSMDYGFDLSTDDGRVFSVTWDPPGWHEGISLREEPLLGVSVRSEADVAIWDVSRDSGWAPLVGARITRVELRYRPWSDAEGGFWCPQISIAVEDVAIEVIMADADQGRLAPSADNVAVLFSPTVLPAWH